MSKCLRFLSSNVFILLLILTWATAASAQTGGTLQGPVTDDQGLALPGATVTLTNAETGWTRTRVELFVEALNVTNHVNFARPEGNIRSAAFGRATTIHDDSSPRQVEIGFRLDF